MNNNWLKYLVAIAAIMIAGSAAYFSVTGLGVLFSGAAIAIMVMATSLEFAKLVTATYLKQEWNNIKGFNKWYLSAAVGILMLITSAGIFGYLSNAFQQQNLKLEQVQREVDVWSNKIKLTNDQILTLQGQQKDLSNTQSTLITKGKINSRLIRSADNRDRQSTKLSNRINILQDSIVVYNGKINDIKNNNIEIEREVGGFRFVAESFGVELNSVVKFFIILIVVVFDPLAVALVISFNQLMIGNKRKEDELEPITEPSTNPEDLKQFVDETARIKLSQEDLNKLESILLNPPSPNEKLKEAAQRYSEEVKEKHTHIDDFDVNQKWDGIPQEVWDRMEEIEKQRESVHGPILDEDIPTGALANSEYRERGEILAEMMKNDEELGLYNEPFDNPLIKEVEERDEEPYAGPIPTKEPEIIEETKEEDISDWDVTLMDGLEDEEPFFTEEEIKEIFQEEPTVEEEEENFSTNEPISENIFQEEEQFNIPVDESIDNEPELMFSDEFLTQAIEEFNRESLEEEEENEPIYQSETKEIDQMLDIVNNVIDEEEVKELETSPEEDDEKKN
jgi:hypothetical protein